MTASEGSHSRRPGARRIDPREGWTAESRRMRTLPPRSPGLALAAFALAACLAFAAEPPPAPPLLPPVDAASALAGRELPEALRRGGYVLFLRHAEQADVPQNDCKATVLTAKGIAQAVRLGETLRQAAIPVDAPVASPICRALHTAQRLGLGEPRIDPALVPDIAPELVAGRDRLLSTLPPPGRNTLLVGHVVAGEPGKQLSTEKGGIIVFRPDGAGGRSVVAHVLPGTWAEWAAAGTPAR